MSIFLPTHRAGREVRQDPIRLKNLLDEAHGQLVESGMRSPEAAAMLDEGRRLVEDGTFWQYQEDGLALFTARGMTETFRLPQVLDPLSVVADAFHVKPLLSALGHGERFFILALSRNRVRLLWATRHRCGEIDLPEQVPESMAEALWFEDPEKQLQYHGADRAGRGRVVATFHGHGSPDEHDDERILSFFRAVDQGIHELVGEDRPIVLAGVEELIPLYREASGHRALVDEGVVGNPDEVSAEELHGRAWPKVEPLFLADRESDASAVSRGGDHVLLDVPQVVSAAAAGRVAALFTAAHRQVWGGTDPVTGEVWIHETRRTGDLDLLDVAAAESWTKGARIHVVDSEEMPGGSELAAVLRY